VNFRFCFAVKSRPVIPFPEDNAEINWSEKIGDADNRTQAGGVKAAPFRQAVTLPLNLPTRHLTVLR